MSNIANILTIAGSDSSAGAGIQADLKTIMALGGYGLSVITALTAQNGLGVQAVHAPDTDFLLQQLKSITDAFTINAAKTGMLFSAKIILALVPKLTNRNFPLVIDPVCSAQSGSSLLQPDALDALKNQLIPLADLLTPNIPEAELLTNTKIQDQDALFKSGQILLDMGAKAVLIKGGHAPKPSQADKMISDYLFIKGQEVICLQQPYIETNNNHGTGCTLSSAIATKLGQGLTLVDAIKAAQSFLNSALANSYAPGLGAGPVNHATYLNIPKE